MGTRVPQVALAVCWSIQQLFCVGALATPAGLLNRRDAWRRKQDRSQVSHGGQKQSLRKAPALGDWVGAGALAACGALAARV